MQHFSLIYFDGIFEEKPIKLSRLQRTDILQMRQLSAHRTQRECQVERVQVSACVSVCECTYSN